MSIILNLKLLGWTSMWLSATLCLVIKFILKISLVQTSFRWESTYFKINDSHFDDNLKIDQDFEFEKIIQIVFF